MKFSESWLRSFVNPPVAGDEFTRRSRVELIGQADHSLVVVDVVFQIMATKFAGEALEFHPVAGPVGVAGGKEALVLGGGRCCNCPRRDDQQRNNDDGTEQETAERWQVRHVISCSMRRKP